MCWYWQPEHSPKALHLGSTRSLCGTDTDIVEGGAKEEEDDDGALTILNSLALV